MAAAVLGTAAEAAYHDGDLDRAAELANRGLELSAEADDVGACLLSLASVALARGEFERAVLVSQRAVGRRAAEIEGVGALAMAYSGREADALAANRRAYRAVTAPTLQAWNRYIDAEIESRTGQVERAAGDYTSAITLARRAGSTFVVGVSTVGLLSGRMAAERPVEALAGHRDIIDYFVTTGNWTHLWTTIRNLAALLGALGDEETATLLDADADAALAVGDVEIDAEAGSGPGWEVAVRRAIGSIDERLAADDPVLLTEDQDRR